MQAAKELEPVAADTCRLYVVRHGTTRLNTESRYRGRLNVPLDHQGWEDAHSAGRALKEVGLSAIYTSPLDRARDTGRIIASYSGLSAVEDHPGLVNVDYGKWSGLTAHGAAALDPRAFFLYRNRPERAVCPGGEALADAMERMIQALTSIGARHPGQVVCGVSHAVMIRLALTRLLGLKGSEWRIPVGLGSMTVFEVTAGTVSVVESEGFPGQIVRPTDAQGLPDQATGDIS